MSCDDKSYYKELYRIFAVFWPNSAKLAKYAISLKNIPEKDLNGRFFTSWENCPKRLISKKIDQNKMADGISATGHSVI